MTRELSNYRTLVFDCDGVLLNSNKVKTQAFYKATLPYGEQAAQAMVAYHVSHGGISRYKKFEYFLQTLAPTVVDGPTLEDLLLTYAQEVRRGLLRCDVASGIQKLRSQTAGARWLVASGGDQAELRALFETRELAELFDGGIFGSPDDKADIVAREIANGNIQAPTLFIGDSRYDHVVAVQNNIDFVFLSGWSEFSGWQEYCSIHSISALELLEDFNEGKNDD